MSPEAITAERVYRRLKAELLNGRFSPGAAINVHSIAAELDLSISPVRDALSRLVGEDIVAMRVGGGFQVPPTDEHDVRDLYAWHERLLLWALQAVDHFENVEAWATLIQVADETDGNSFAEMTAELFSWIGDQSGNREHAIAVRKVADRLKPLRICETFLPGRVIELVSIVEGLRDHNDNVLRHAVTTYHRRRIDDARRLIELRYAPVNRSSASPGS